MNGWEFTINTGNPDVDRQSVEAYRQAATAQQLVLHVTPLATGGFHVRAAPPGAPPPSAGVGGGFAGGFGVGGGQQQDHGMYGPPPGAPQGGGMFGGAPPQQHQGAGMFGPPPGAPAGGGGGGGMFGNAPPHQQQAHAAQGQTWGVGAAAVASAGFGGGMAAPAFGISAPPIEGARVAYLRKVYGLLLGSALVAVLTGAACIYLGPQDAYQTSDGQTVMVPVLVATMLQNRVLLYASFGVLFLATIVAGWVSRVKVLNVIALFGVAALMGFELAPMVFVAQLLGGMGESFSANPVRDAGAMTSAVFFGITLYVYVTRKDFSYLKAVLNMSFWVVFVAGILAGFVGSEPFSLAVAGFGSLVAAGFLLYVTSWIFRNSEMDDPVGDALALLVQLRNLFMFLLRIFMSARD